MDRLEKEIENDCRKIAELHGCMLLKIVSPNRAGIPDRLFIGHGVMIWMEFKKPKSGRASALQDRTLAKLREMGHAAHLVDSVLVFELITGLK